MPTNNFMPSRLLTGMVELFPISLFPVFTVIFPMIFTSLLLASKPSLFPTVLSRSFWNLCPAVLLQPVLWYPWLIVFLFRQFFCHGNTVPSVSYLLCFAYYVFWLAGITFFGFLRLRNFFVVVFGVQICKSLQSAFFLTIMTCRLSSWAFVVGVPILCVVVYTILIFWSFCRS